MEARFGELDAVAKRLGIDAVDGIVLDIGVSSMQLDEAARGSRYVSTRLWICGWRQAAVPPPTSCATKMRRQSPTLCSLREERAARRIARAIVADREANRSPRRGARRDDCEGRAGAAWRTHPSWTRAFQALRIAVNDELGELVRGLCAAERLSTWRAASDCEFHSLEDRIVKQFLAGRSGRGRTASRRLPGEPAEAEPTFDAPRGQPSEPSEAEAQSNPRSRSAKLRFGVRTGAPNRGRDEGIEALARLPARRGR